MRIFWGLHCSLRLMNLTIIGIFIVLTHHPLVPHICVSELGQHSLNGTIFSAIWIKIHNFTFTKIHLKMPSTKWRPFCLRGNEFNKSLTANVRRTMAQDYLNHWQYDECNWTKTVQGMVLAGPIRLYFGYASGDGQWYQEHIQQIYYEYKESQSRENTNCCHVWHNSHIRSHVQISSLVTYLKSPWEQNEFSQSFKNSICEMDAEYTINLHQWLMMFVF